jgi:hypothetical protein
MAEAGTLRDAWQRGKSSDWRFFRQLPLWFYKYSHFLAL